MLNKTSGFTLIQVLINAAIMIVIFWGFSQAIEIYTKQQQTISYSDRKQEILVTIVNLLNNDTAWQKTTDYLANTTMDCLKDKAKFPSISNAGKCLITDGGKFSLLNDKGEIYLDNTVLTSGFSLNAGPCSLYSSSGNDTCPLRAEVTWRPLCVTSANNQVEITIELKDTPLNRKTIQAPSISRKLIRYSPPRDPDLVLFLKLDGTTGASAPVNTLVTDYSIYKNKATISEWSAGTAPSFDVGKVGQGLRLENTKYISVADSAALRPSTLITVSAWVNLYAPTASAGIIDKRIAGIMDSYLLRAKGNGFEFCLAEKPLARCVLGDIGSVSLLTWYHVAGVWDGSEMRVYINGALIGTPLAYTGQNFWSTDPLIIGTENEAGNLNNSFPGIIDQVKIWKRALSPSEIANEYNNP